MGFIFRGLWFRVQGSAFGVNGLGVWVQGLRLRTHRSGGTYATVTNSRVKDSRFSDFRVYPSILRADERPSTCARETERVQRERERRGEIEKRREKPPNAQHPEPLTHKTLSGVCTNLKGLERRTHPT